MRRARAADDEGSYAKITKRPGDRAAAYDHDRPGRGRHDPDAATLGEMFTRYSRAVTDQYLIPHGQGFTQRTRARHRRDVTDAEDGVFVDR